MDCFVAVVVVIVVILLWIPLFSHWNDYPLAHSIDDLFSCGSAVAAQRGEAAPIATAGVVTPAATAATNISGIPPTANIVQGYDIEALVSAAMGAAPMPTAPTYLDAFGMPLTRLVATPIAAAAVAAAPLPVPQQPAHGGGQAPSALDIANAALAALGGSAPPAPTRVLVLSNMVLMEDLASDADYQGLQEEVREECAKYGQLRGMQIPRSAGGSVQQSAVLKIFLEYASVQDAQAADRELNGRKFGDNVVQVCFN